MTTATFTNALNSTPLEQLDPEIAAAIAAQDPEAAAAAMQHHLERVADVRLLTWSPR